MKSWILIILLLLPVAAYSEEDQSSAVAKPEPASEPQSASGPSCAWMDRVAYGDYLFDLGEYYRAAGAYFEYRFFCPEGPGLDWVNFQLGSTYYLAGQYERAAQFWQARADDPALTDAERMMAAYWAGMTFSAREQHHWAAAEFRRVAQAEDEAAPEAIRFGAGYREGWSYLRSLELDRAQNHFEATPEGSPHREAARAVIAGIERYRLLPSKSPVLAGFMSAILPGAGQAYTGHWRDATSALVINGALIWGTVASIVNHQFGLTAVLTLFVTGFYAGNIYAAVNFAHKDNRRIREEFLDNLEREWGPSTGGAAWEEFRVQWRWEF